MYSFDISQAFSPPPLLSFGQPSLLSFFQVSQQLQLGLFPWSCRNLGLSSLVCGMFEHSDCGKHQKFSARHSEFRWKWSRKVSGIQDRQGKTYQNVFVPVSNIWRASSVRSKRLAVPLPTKRYLIHGLFDAENFPRPQPRNNFRQLLSAQKKEISDN